jgi:hypothetical protein
MTGLICVRQEHRLSVVGEPNVSGAAYFNQDCPVCGRGLRVRVAYLGKQVACQHCGGRFEACDPESAHYSRPSDSANLSGIALLQRAEELIETANQLRAKGA